MKILHLWRLLIKLLVTLMTDMIFISALCAGRKEVTNMPDKLMLSAEDVAALLSIAKPKDCSELPENNSKQAYQGWIPGKF